MKYPFLYPYLYQQCKNTFGYDDLIKRLGGYKILLSILDVNCMYSNTTLFVESELSEVCKELIDFLDGNGFIIKHSNNMIHIIPIKKENIK